MAEKCIALNRHCPECGRDHKPRVPVCECGRDLGCTKWAVPGYKYCERHGGPAPSRNFYGRGRGIVTGENSQFALTRLSSKYLEQTRDGRTLSNRAGMEVLDKRIAQLLERLENGNFPNQLMDLRNLWAELLPYLGGIPLEGQKVKRELEERFEAVYHDYMAFAQIQSVLETRRKMAETEAKIAKDLHAILTAEDAYKLVAKLQAAIIASIQQEPEIPDRVKSHFLKRIEYEFTRIIGEGSVEGSGGGVGEIIDA